MRPEVLFSMFAPVTAIKGVGQNIAKSIAKLAGPQVADLLWHLPTGLIDRRFAPKVAGAPDGSVATLTVTVDAHLPPYHARLPYKIRCSDETGSLHLVFFNMRAEYLKKTLPEGEVRVVSGKVEYYDGTPQMAHPDHIATTAELDRVCVVEPVYPLTAGLSLKVLIKAIHGALDHAPELGEWIDPAFRRRQGWPSWRDALNAAHAPADESDLLPTTAPRQRLAYDELLASQLAVAIVRTRIQRRTGRPLTGDGNLRKKVRAALPYNLTTCQETALGEIDADLAMEGRMLRMLQGDVGSGKTVVALMAMLTAVEAGAQATLMAPTEVLAQQHHKTISPLAQACSVRTILLTGRVNSKMRQEALAAIATGDISIVVGTHALLQEDVIFRSLRLAVIDEQHRFGVHQRLLLASKGDDADVLVMTATPIPRTLMLAAYGDLDCSRLTEKPAGRMPVDTTTHPLTRLDDVVAAVGRKLDAGAKVYWVCPLVEESETVDLAAATNRFDTLKAIYGTRVGLIHGRLKGQAKDSIMNDFSNGAIDLLVATTVIEVGVDVPAATVMVVEHAERFGLAQLHQLRGRVGRSERVSTCLLLYGQPLGATARERLSVLRHTDDGFRIAEEDLRLRGAGEVLGTRQSGLPEFHLADLAAHSDLLAAARDDARQVLEQDPDLKSARGRALKVLLYLFERDAVVKYAQVA